MEKQAFLEILLKLVGKYGLGSVSKFLNKGFGNIVGKSAPGSMRRGLSNTIGGAGKHLTNAADYLTKNPVLSDAALGATMAALPMGDPDQGFASKAMTEIPSMIGWGLGMRSAGKAIGPWWEGMKAKRAAAVVEPQRLAKTLEWLNKRTMLENALVGTAAGAGVGTVTDQGPLQGLLHGSAIGTGVGLGSLAGTAAGEKLTSTFPKGMSKILTKPSAGIAGAVAGGVLAHQLYKILAGQKKQSSDKQALVSILREHLERQRHTA